LLSVGDDESERANYVRANVTADLFVTPAYARLAWHLLQSQSRAMALEAVDADEDLHDNAQIAALLMGETPLDASIDVRAARDMVLRLQRRQEERAAREMLQRALAGDQQAERLYTERYRLRDGVPPAAT
jgi:hypothetical protein